MDIRRFVIFVIVALLCISCSDNGGAASSDTSLPNRPSAELPLTISVTDITPTTARVSVEPKQPSVPYYFDLLSEQFYDEYSVRGFQLFLDNTIQVLMASNGQSKAQVLSQILSEGRDEHLFTDLEAGSVYYVVAMYVDSDGQLCSEVATAQFTTSAISPSHNSFELQLGSASYDGVAYTVTPTIISEPYILIPWNRQFVDQASDEEFISHCIGRSDIERFCCVGAQSGVIEGCMPGWEYYLVAFGYQGGVATTGLFKIPFTTDGGSEPDQCRFTFDVFGIDYEGATVRVTASAAHNAFFWDIVEGSLYATLVAEVGVEQAMERLLSQALEQHAVAYGSKYNALETLCSYGEVRAQRSFNNLRQGTEYIPWAVCIDSAGNAIARFAVGESFTTQAEMIAECTVSVKGSYYEGNDGKAVVLSTVTPDIKCAGFYNIILQGDLSGYSRRAMIENITRDSYFRNLNPFKAEKYPWNQTLTAVAVGFDAAGNFGEIAMDVFTPTK